MPARLLDPNLTTIKAELAGLRRYTNNPRKNDRAVPKIMAALKAFGWRQPIVVDANMEIVVGDRRYLAAQRLGLTHAPVHVASDLTPDEIRSYRLADNRIGEDTEWDEELLSKELEALEAAGADLSVAGFDEDELAKLLDENDDAPSQRERVEVQPFPATTWVLIGVPSVRYVEIADAIEQIAAIPDVFCELTANDTKPPAPAAPAEPAGGAS